MSVREILLATDFSDVADEAVRVAREYAQRFDARVHLFHTLWSGEKEVTRLFALTREKLGDAVPVVIASAGGDPAEEIVRYAGAHDIDLIVVGTHVARASAVRCSVASPSASSGQRPVPSWPCPHGGKGKPSRRPSRRADSWAGVSCARRPRAT